MPNPSTKEFPLRHKFAYDFSLLGESTVNNFATMLPLVVADQAKTEALAQAVQVNPVNDTYEGIISSPNCFMNSRINKIKITEYHRMKPAADPIDCLFHKALITWGLGDHAILDPQGNTILSKLKFTKAADTIHPTFNAVNMQNGSDTSSEQDGLTGDAELEGVTIRPVDLFNERQGSLGAKIKKMMIGPMRQKLLKDFPIYRSRWYNLPGSTKRMNAFTGCFMYLGFDAAKTGDPSAPEPYFSSLFLSETTVDEALTNHHYLLEFNEYNDSFDHNA